MEPHSWKICGFSPPPPPPCPSLLLSLTGMTVTVYQQEPINYQELLLAESSWRLSCVFLLQTWQCTILLVMRLGAPRGSPCTTVVVLAGMIFLCSFWWFSTSLSKHYLQHVISSSSPQCFCRRTCRGEVINGGFGLLLDGSDEAARRASLMLNWDVSNGVRALSQIEEECTY